MNQDESNWVRPPREPGSLCSWWPVPTRCSNSPTSRDRCRPHTTPPPVGTLSCRPIFPRQTFFRVCLVGDGVKLKPFFVGFGCFVRPRIVLQHLLVSQCLDESTVRPLQFLNTRPQVVRAGDILLGRQVVDSQAQQAGQCNNPAATGGAAVGASLCGCWLRRLRGNSHQ